MERASGIEPETSITMAMFTVKMTFSTAEWPVRSCVDSKQEPSTQDLKEAQVTLIPATNFNSFQANVPYTVHIFL